MGLVHNAPLRPALREREKVVGPHLIGVGLKVFCPTSVFPRSHSGAITSGVLYMGDAVLIFDPVVHG